MTVAGVDDAHAALSPIRYVGSPYRPSFQGVPGRPQGPGAACASRARQEPMGRDGVPESPPSPCGAGQPEGNYEPSRRAGPHGPRCGSAFGRDRLREEAPTGTPKPGSRRQLRRPGPDRSTRPPDALAPPRPPGAGANVREPRKVFGVPTSHRPNVPAEATGKGVLLLQGAAGRRQSPRCHPGPGFTAPGSPPGARSGCGRTGAPRRSRPGPRGWPRPRGTRPRPPAGGPRGRPGAGGTP